jgi:hypothetical protein
VGRGFSRVLPDGLVVLVTLVLTWPMWTAGGYGLARDLVFTPRAPWSMDAIGMGTSLPRAVPVDAVLAALTTVLDGAVVFRVAVAGVLLLAGWGAHRLLANLLPEVSTAARCVTAVAALWNPYVVERLALGQWALLAGYAALWWLLPAVRRVLAGERRAWFAVVAWAWVGSITPTGGAVLVLVTTAGLLVARSRRSALVLLVTVAAQVPWVLAGVLGTPPATSDAAGVDVFAARAERAGGVWVTLLGTGGVWSPFQVPGSLTAWPGHLLTVLVLVVLAAGGLLVARREPALALAAAVGFVFAGIAHLPGGADALGWSVAHVPGAGLLRDGQKWLLPFVVVVAAPAGSAATRAEAARRGRDADLGRLRPGALVLVPLVLMPDAAARTWEVVRPVTYPAALAEAVAVLDDSPDTGDAITLPWQSYREFTWGNPVSAADPLPRWTRHPVVVSDLLVVDRGRVVGEDPRSQEVAAVVAEPDGPLAQPLAELGVGWVLVYRDQPGAADLDTTGLTTVVEGPDVALYEVPGVDDRPVARPRGTAAVAVADVLWALTGLVGVLGALITLRRGRRQKVTDG